MFGQELTECGDLSRCFPAGQLAAGEIGHEIRELHVVGRGVAGLQEVDEVLEEIDLAGDPECALVGEPELLLGQPEEALEQRVVKVVGLHLELAEGAAVLLPDADPDVAFGEWFGFGARGPEALCSAAPHLLQDASHGDRYRVLDLRIVSSLLMNPIQSDLIWRVFLYLAAKTRDANACTPLYL